MNINRIKELKSIDGEIGSIKYIPLEFIQRMQSRDFEKEGSMDSLSLKTLIVREIS